MNCESGSRPENTKKAAVGLGGLGGLGLGDLDGLDGLDLYLKLESMMSELYDMDVVDGNESRLPETAAEAIRDVMDQVWFSLMPDERNFLSDREFKYQPKLDHTARQLKLEEKMGKVIQTFFQDVEEVPLVAPNSLQPEACAKHGIQTCHSCPDYTCGDNMRVIGGVYAPTPEPSQDIVNDPQHYTVGVEVLQYVDSWKLNFSCGNAVKYITRALHKGKPVEDLAKALFYVAFELEKQGGADAITKFAERWLKRKTMLTKKYVLE